MPRRLASVSRVQKPEPVSEYMQPKAEMIGKIIRQNRKLRRFTDEQLADYLEISQSYVGLLERGKRVPSVELVYRIMELYNLTPNEVLLPPPDEDGHMIAEERDSYSVIQKKNAILSLLEGMDDDDLDFITSVVSAYNKRALPPVDGEEE
ncbi:MAG: helix-turn-helix domain-containing protein [Defluviitaleaceae bacterium]|nr:helix-turn-helix domain-containing protein [Defluviitaleaceae bacterium]